ncbi:MAG: acetyl-CoA carboxylase carboxyl transferase subunit alpha [Pelagibacteraceae bacterium]|nr:acetyl-CoA carboxylase carboxyl transferase subunit alpha [Pelagibacteraceae bacterium]|tara:strand:- start:14218 stop:15156 length:939 start_codon:yes stop_codon:yes gene_type:complete
MIKYFDFEKKIESIEKIINSNNSNQALNDKNIDELILEKKREFKKIYSKLTPWQKVQVARHGERPHAIDYVKNIFSNIFYLHGDKKFADDKAVIGGFGKIDQYSVIFIGTEKGNDMESRIKHNFGMARPEGYRKAQRLMQIAEKFKLPIVTFVDTAGAFPGKDAEERGQSESIASSILLSLKIKTPLISVIIGEGGSGGAIGLATSDISLMLEHAIFSVISPEGCASILWRNTDFAQKAADSLKLTAQDCKNFKIIDEIIPEIPGGAHRFPKEQSTKVSNYIIKYLEELKKIKVDSLVKKRNEKYLHITSNI